MTACTNHGGKARRVVTAALVGVLSVGTVPMVALAAGAESGDGIQALTADWSTGAKVTEAEDGKGAAYTGDLTKPVSFDLGSGKYLVPTQVTNQNGDETDVTNMAITYKAQKDSTDAVKPFDGITAGWSYTYVKDDGTYAPIVMGDALTVDHFEAYLAGRLYTCNGMNAAVNNGAVIPVAGTYTVTVGGQVSQSFTLVDEDPYAGAYAYEVNNSDYATTTDTDIVYNGGTVTVAFAYANGNQIHCSSTQEFKYFSSNGSEVKNFNAPGDYTAVLYDESLNTSDNVAARISFTVQKFDISKHGAAFVDQYNLDSGTVTKDSFLKTVAGNVLWTAFQITDITAPSGAKGFDGSYGEYTVTVAAKTDVNDQYYDANVTGEKTYTFSNLNTNIYDTLDLYYGAQDVSTDKTVTVNLTEGQSFDASRISVRDKDGSPSYSGDALEVTYKQGSTTVDASALSKADTYEVTVRVKPFQDADGKWVGGTESFEVTVNGNKAYGENVSFYVDGEVADATERLEYDGTDLLQRVSARVSNPEGGQFEYGTDFTLEAKNEADDVVESVVDAGEYTVSIKPLTFTVDDGEIISFTLEVTARQLDNLKDFKYNGDTLTPNWITGNYSGYRNDAVAWTGSAVEVPGVQYEDAKGNYVTLDPSLYNVVRITDEDGKVVDEVVDKGTYTVKIALSDEAKSNYALEDREFDFEVVKYAPFDDVESPAWYASAIADAKYTNIVHGIGGTDMFAPGAQITRAEAVCIVYNLAGGDNIHADYSFSVDGGYVTGFSDVDGHDYYARALAWAHNAGVVNGNGGKFDPDGKLTREQLAAMLANYAIATGDYEASDGSALAALPDASSVSGWAQGAVAWAVENGIMGNGGSVMAQSTITRSEVAAMAVNYASKF